MLKDMEQRHMFKSFGTRVAWEKEDEEWIEKNFHMKVSHCLSDMLRDASLGRQPHWIGNQLWQQLEAHWNSPEFKVTSEKARKNRAYEKGGSLHTGGSVSQAQYAARLSKRFGREVQLHELHRATHIRRNTSDFVDERSRRTQEEFEARISQIRSQSSSCSPSQSPEDPSAPLRIWADVVGGKKKGRLYGVGDLASNYRKGVSCLHIGESSSSGGATRRSDVAEQGLAEMRRTLAEQQEESCQTKAILAQLLQRQEEMYQRLARRYPPLPSPPPPSTDDHVDDADGVEHLDHDQDYQDY